MLEVLSLPLAKRAKPGANQRIPCGRQSLSDRVERSGQTGTHLTKAMFGSVRGLMAGEA